MVYFAHSEDKSKSGRWHPLATHLASVALLARSFAAGQPWEEEAALAGLLHDLGKYGDKFQARLRGQSSGLDHWTAGAWVALRDFRSVGAALAIQAHHIGLQRGDNDALHALAGTPPKPIPATATLTDDDFGRLMDRLRAEILVDMPTSTPPTMPVGTVGWMSNVRMLFSALVDADYLDTDAHFRGNIRGKRPHVQGIRLDPNKGMAALVAARDLVRARSRAADNLIAVRDVLWSASMLSAERAQGIYTMSAPTGSGKTLSMLGFALRHAQVHGLDRIIIALPYLSILDQTAQIVRGILEPVFGPTAILEHHSLSDVFAPENEKEARRDFNATSYDTRLLTENWDAPVIITTNVQLLQSLFSNMPSACRKLHRLRRSVLIFDEAQSLPNPLVVPTLAALRHLIDATQCTVLFATATQPAFTHLSRNIAAFPTPNSGKTWTSEEIVPDPKPMFEAARRSVVRWPAQKSARLWTELAEELAQHEQVLCIVNLKDHATRLVRFSQALRPDGLWHMSTSLCPAHRAVVLSSVRAALEAGSPCRLISTQCIEAGVDIDFPIVYRAFGPLEAVAQAAGRCNREGKRSEGEVRVFRPDPDGRQQRWLYPSAEYYQASQVTDALLRELGHLDIHDPALFTRYYRRLYNLGHADHDPELANAITRRDFPAVAARYKLIPQDSLRVVVPYDLEIWADLLDAARQDGLSRDWTQRAAPHAVSLPRPKPNDPVWTYLEPVQKRSGRGDSEHNDWALYREPAHYDPMMGLLSPRAPQTWII